MASTEQKPVDTTPFPFPTSKSEGCDFPTAKGQADKAAKAEQDSLEKNPDELSADELRLMADTMPGEGPGD